MRLLALTNLYPPHQAGTQDLRCQALVDNLRLRGHEVRVLTSTCGIRSPQCDAEVERKLKLNGAFDHPRLTRYSELHPLEVWNSQGLRESLANFKPDLVHVFSLCGLSKSLLFTLRQERVPTVFDVADAWLSEEVKADPWLKWWNHPGFDPARALKELAGGRHRVDAQAPTLMMKGYDRVPELYGRNPTPPEPNSIAAFRFERLYFCSQALKTATEQAGFVVSHGEVIHPGVATQAFVGEVRPAALPTRKLLIVARLNRASGVLTAVKALQLARAAQAEVQLTICGKGDSEYIAAVRSLVASEHLPVAFLSVSNQRRELQALYRQHEVLLYPGEEPEPFSLTPLEAMTSGLAVVGTPLGGVGELLRPGENALVFEPGSAEQLAGCIQELTAQPGLREKLAEAAQAEVLSQHNETVVTDRVENYLETSLQTWQAQ